MARGELDLLLVRRLSWACRVYQSVSQPASPSIEAWHELVGWHLVWRVAAAFLFVSVARVLFRGQNLEEAWNVFSALFGPDWGFGHIHWKIWLFLGVSFRSTGRLSAG